MIKAHKNRSEKIGSIFGAAKPGAHSSSIQPSRLFRGLAFFWGNSAIKNEIYDYNPHNYQLHVFRKVNGIAQLVECSFHNVTWDISPRVNFHCQLSYGVRTAPCAIACIIIHAFIKNPKHWQPCLFGLRKIVHTLVGMGSAAHVAAVSLSKTTRISCKGFIKY